MFLITLSSVRFYFNVDIDYNMKPGSACHKIVISDTFLNGGEKIIKFPTYVNGKKYKTATTCACVCVCV